MPILRSPAAVVRILARGGVVLLPTDTLPGLHCRVDRIDAIRRIRRIKEISDAKPMLLLCSSIAQACGLVSGLDGHTTSFARRCWPGPFTLIMAAGADAPPAAVSLQGTIAIRVPAWSALRDLVAKVGCPLISTSANPAGKPPCNEMDAATRTFAGQVDAIGDLPVNQLQAPSLGRASALVDLTQWPPRLRREGAMPLPE